MWGQHESLLEREFWSGGFWERSFYVGTTDEMSSRTVEGYINRTEHVEAERTAFTLGVRSRGTRPVITVAGSLRS